MGAPTDPSKNYFNAVWDLHKVETLADQTDIIAVDTVVALDRPPDGTDLSNPESILAITCRPADAAQAAQLAYQSRSLRLWARRHDVRLLEAGEDGIPQVLSSQPAAIAPGSSVICQDPRTCTLGALGALALGTGITPQSAALLTACIVMERPLVMRVLLTGELEKAVSAFDLGLHIVSKLGAFGGTGFALEFAGSLIPQLDMDQRLTLCDMVTETGATTAIIQADANTAAFAGREFCPPPSKWISATQRTSDPCA